MNKPWVQDFLKNGFVVFDCNNLENLDILRTVVEHSLGSDCLDLIHQRISINDLNQERLNAYRALNTLKDWERLYKSLASIYIDDLLGPDIAIQSKLNLSIQMPLDDTSLLQLHTDTLSGQSVFEIVLWVPLTDCSESNSIYLFNIDVSKKILFQLSSYEQPGMLQLYEDNKNEATFMSLSYGQCLIFTPTLFHGNKINQTTKTRISINCRFKNIFSPEAISGERRLGSFYRILDLSPVTLLGLAHRDDMVTFE